LIIDDKKTAEFKRANMGEVEFHKVFLLNKGRLSPLFQVHLDYAEDEGDDGWIRAPEKNRDMEEEGAVQGGAYHAYLNKGRAEEIKKFMTGVRARSTTIVRSVTVPTESVVAVGRENDVAFTKMKVDVHKGERF